MTKKLVESRFSLSFVICHLSSVIGRGLAEPVGFNPGKDG
jgi:hypothetical protein